MESAILRWNVTSAAFAANEHCENSILILGNTLRIWKSVPIRIGFFLMKQTKRALKSNTHKRLEERALLDVCIRYHGRFRHLRVVGSCPSISGGASTPRFSPLACGARGRDGIKRFKRNSTPSTCSWRFSAEHARERKSRSQLNRPPYP